MSQTRLLKICTLFTKHMCTRFATLSFAAKWHTLQVYTSEGNSFLRDYKVTLLQELR